MHHNISFIMLLIRYLIARSHANFFSLEIIVLIPLNNRISSDV